MNSSLLKHRSEETQRFLLALTSLVLSSIDAPKRSQLNSFREKEWQHSYNLAAQLKIAPIFFSLKNEASPDAEAKQCSNLQYLSQCAVEDYKQHKLRVLKLIYELARVTSILSQANIDVIPFKGVVLSQKIYGDLYRRSFDDLDILVSREKFIDCRNLLIEKGYVPAGYEHLDNSKAEKLAIFLGECTLVHPISQVCVDLHSGWLGNGKLTLATDLSVFSSRLESAQISSYSFDTLSKEDTVLFLCLSGLKDSWISLRAVCDLATLLNTELELDWELVYAEARRMKIERVVNMGLLVAREVLNATLPKEVLQTAVLDPKTVLVSKKVSRRIVDRIDGKYFWVNEFYLNFSLKWIAIEHWKERKVYLKGIIRRVFFLTFSINSHDINFIRFHRRFYFLYYVVRPFRLIVSYRASVLKVLLK